MSNTQTLSPTDSRTITPSKPIEPRQTTALADILENEDHYLVLADMPGVSPDDVAITVEAGELSIEGKLTAIDGSLLVYQRSFRVGPGVNPQGVSAELKHGVLHLIAKKSESTKPRQISVKAG